MVSLEFRDIVCAGDRLEIAGDPRTASVCRYDRNSDKILMSASTCTRLAPYVHLLVLSIIKDRVSVIDLLRAHSKP